MLLKATKPANSTRNSVYSGLAGIFVLFSVIFIGNSNGSSDLADIKPPKRVGGTKMQSHRAIRVKYMKKDMAAVLPLT